MATRTGILLSLLFVFTACKQATGDNTEKQKPAFNQAGGNHSIAKRRKLVSQNIYAGFFLASNQNRFCFACQIF